MKFSRYVLCLSLGLSLFACKKKEEPASNPSQPGPAFQAPTSQASVNKNLQPPTVAPVQVDTNSTEQLDALLMVNVDSVYHQFQDFFQTLINKNFEKAEATETNKKVVEFFKKIIFQVLDNFRNTQLQVKFYNKKEVEFGLNFQFKPIQAKWEIREPFLAQFLPADDMVRAQGAFLSNSGLETLVNQFIQIFITPENKKWVESYQPQIKEMFEHLEGDQFALSATQTSPGTIPRLLIIDYPKDITKASSIYDAFFLTTQPPVNKTSIRLGKENKEYPHYKFSVSTEGPRIYGEIAIFNKYVLMQINGTAQDLQNLALAIESGQGHPLKAMNLFGKSGSFYVDVNFKKAVELALSKDSAVPNLITTLLTSLSSNDEVISVYINNDVQNSWLKVRVPVVAIQLFYMGYNMSKETYKRTQSRMEEENQPDKNLKLPASTETQNPSKGQEDPPVEND